ncbi:MULTISPECIES: DUF2723 domain-containing protein [unclassified Ruegeria]|uniref:DUF2723 domain-containing protein n=1 Tax=unclassified Ruegeria TaxID=2625375 RepID=UPI001488E12C|nr:MULTISPECIES: DUF2723 domain-containing protein [unclassified Ruegeria]
MIAARQTQSFQALLRVSVFCILTVSYLVTAPEYHTTAIDSYYFAEIISQHDLFEAPVRLLLWLSSMQLLYRIVSIFQAEPDPFLILSIANAIFASLSVILLERLLSRQFAVPSPASWLTAATFGVSYGTWRYATELEVYPSAMLFTIVLLTLAFSSAGMVPSARSKRIWITAIAGAVASFFYQPLGIVAGIAIPVFFLSRRVMKDLIQYCAIYGLFLAAGFLSLARTGGSSDPLHTILDTDGKVVVLPDMVSLSASAVAFFQNLLSANWMFAFPPTRDVIESKFADHFMHELVATDPAYWGYRLFLLTIPAALVLLLLAVVRVLKARERRPLTSPELSAISLLTVQALMVLGLHPEGFEAWLPTLVPVFLLLGSRISGPLQRSGHVSVLVLIVAVFGVHNWFAGVGVFANATRDYNRILAEPAITRLGEKDLVIIGADWPLFKYLNYVGAADTIFAKDTQTDVILSRLEGTMDSGHQVMIYPDVIAPSVLALKQASNLTEVYSKMPKQAIAKGEKIEFGELGYGLLLKNNRN